MRFGIIGIPNTTGELHGANGAQFTGKLIHEPQPNPHAKPFARFSAILEISATACGEKSRLRS